MSGAPAPGGTPTCVYRVDPELIERLDACLGPPLDSYVRGWQVWLEDNGPEGETLEWRLHPPAGFRMPRGVDPHDLFDVVLQGLAGLQETGGDAFPAGRERRTLASIWEALEVYPAFGAGPDDPQRLAQAVTAALRGRAPDAVGRVDHDRLGSLWARQRGEFSMAQALFEQLGG
jgi:hypothetical protein